MALAVTASLVLLAHPARGRRHLIGIGGGVRGGVLAQVQRGAYALPVAVGRLGVGPPHRRDWRHALGDLAWIGVGFGAVAIAVLAYFAANGALYHWRLATIDYNLHYSNETYEGSGKRGALLLTFPIERARVDP